METTSKAYWHSSSHGQAWLELYGEPTSGTWRPILLSTKATMLVSVGQDEIPSLMIVSSLVTALVGTMKATTGFEDALMMLSTSPAIDCRPPRLKLLCWNTVN